METATVPDLSQGEVLARNASRAAKLALLCVIIAVVVLAIDNHLKRQIVTEAEKALKALADAQKIALGVMRDGRSEPAGEASASPGDSKHAGDGVDDAARASAQPDGVAGSGLEPSSGRVARPFGGPGGDE